MSNSYKIASHELKMMQQKEPSVKIWYIVGVYDENGIFHYELTKNLEQYKKQLIDGRISDIDICIGDETFEFTSREG